MKNFETFMELVRGNRDYNGWFQDCDWTYYFDGIHDELKEVKEELKTPDKDILPDGVTKLEDELGDVVWDCMCLIEKLDYEGLIKKDKIWGHAFNKMSERLPYIGGQKFQTTTQLTEKAFWNNAKAKQKERGVIPYKEQPHFKSL